MDWSSFGLNQRPFRTTPDTESWYAASSHESALASLQEAIADDEPFALLQGRAGLGKTITAHRLIETLPEEVQAVFLTHSRYSSRADLLQAILFDLGLPWQNLSEQELRLTLTDACLNHFREEGRILIIADEAQHLSPDLLEELRLLTNLEGSSGRAVQVLLVAQPGLRQTLDLPNLVCLRQRIAAKFWLEPLDSDESADYLRHHLRVAGGRPDRLLPQESVELLTEHCQGIPRILSQAAYLALQLAAQNELESVDTEAVMEALSRLGLLQDDEPEEVAAPAFPMAEIVPPIPEPKPDIRLQSSSPFVNPVSARSAKPVSTGPDFTKMDWLPSTAIPENPHILVYGEEGPPEGCPPDQVGVWKGPRRAG